MADLDGGGAKATADGGWGNLPPRYAPVGTVADNVRAPHMLVADSPELLDWLNEKMRSTICRSSSTSLASTSRMVSFGSTTPSSASMASPASRAWGCTSTTTAAASRSTCS